MEVREHGGLIRAARDWSLGGSLAFNRTQPFDEGWILGLNQSHMSPTDGGEETAERGGALGMERAQRSGGGKRQEIL